MLKNNFVKYTLMFILLVLLQVTILNSISFLGYAIPLVYIYFIIKLPIGLNRNIALVLGFFLGFIIDIFSNTPGMNAAATVFAAFICRPAQNLFFTADDYNDQTPSLSSLGFSFIKYAVFITLIHHIILISIESFSYLNIEMILLRIVLSTLLTTILIFAFEGFSLNKKKTWQKTT